MNKTSSTLTGCPFEIRKQFADCSSFMVMPDGRKIDCLVIHDHGKYASQMPKVIQYHEEHGKKSGNYIDRIGLQQPLKEYPSGKPCRKALDCGESIMINHRGMLWVYLQAKMVKTVEVEIDDKEGKKVFFDVFTIHLPCFHKSDGLDKILGTHDEIEEGAVDKFVWSSYKYSEKIK